MLRRGCVQQNPLPQESKLQGWKAAGVKDKLTAENQFPTGGHCGYTDPDCIVIDGNHACAEGLLHLGHLACHQPASHMAAASVQPKTMCVSGVQSWTLIAGPDLFAS